ncbi:MAG: YerC/YecD family TrpR-related protein [Patescibacteria group bacterium]
MNKKELQKTEDLYQAILGLDNIDEAQRFFRDLLTEQEIIEFGRRWQAAQMLEAKIPYTNIVKETGLSSTTVARVAKWLNQGMQGYKLALAKQNQNHHHPSPSRKG